MHSTRRFEPCGSRSFVPRLFPLTAAAHVALLLLLLLPAEETTSAFFFFAEWSSVGVREGGAVASDEHPAIDQRSQHRLELRRTAEHGFAKALQNNKPSSCTEYPFQLTVTAVMCFPSIPYISDK